MLLALDFVIQCLNINFTVLKLTTMSKWIIDTAHTEIGFKVRHLVVSNTSGKFASFEGTVEANNEDFSDANISFSADVNSLTTANEQRDAHLKSADFFDAANHPRLTFVSTEIVKKKGTDYIVKGNLTIRGTTKPIELEADFGGIHKSPFGHTVAGFDLSGKINRQDFGLTWSALTEAGGLVVGDDVKINISAELIRQD
jgi:polyisoprenoid-binding protein YceI